MTVRTSGTQRNQQSICYLNFSSHQITNYEEGNSGENSGEETCDKTCLRVDISIKKTLKLIEPWITLNCFSRFSLASLIFATVLELPNFFKKIKSMVTKSKGVNLKSVQNFSLIPG